MARSWSTSQRQKPPSLHGSFAATRPGMICPPPQMSKPTPVIRSGQQMEKSRRSVSESDLSRWQSFRPMQREGLHGLQESRERVPGRIGPNTCSRPSHGGLTASLRDLGGSVAASAGEPGFPESVSCADASIGSQPTGTGPFSAIEADLTYPRTPRQSSLGPATAHSRVATEGVQ